MEAFDKLANALLEEEKENLELVILTGQAAYLFDGKGFTFIKEGSSPAGILNNLLLWSAAPPNENYWSKVYRRLAR